MSIRFVCEQCGHVFEVGDELEGRHGKCKRCGHHVVVHATGEAPAGGLRLRPIESEAQRGPMHLLDAPPPLSLRPSEGQAGAWPSAVSQEAEDDRLRKHGHNYTVGRSFDGQSRHRSSGPPPLWWNLPSLTGRAISRLLRKTRDLLYYISLASLVLMLYGFLFKVKSLLHIGSVVIVASNISMFWVGASYLISLPFKDSLLQGLACVLVPGYLLYYWANRWHQLRKAVWNTLAAFVPMLLVALAYFFYKEAPVIQAEIERQAPRVEAEADEIVNEIEHLTH